MPPWYNALHITIYYGILLVEAVLLSTQGGASMHKTIYRAFAIVQKLCKSNIHNNNLLLHACQFHSLFFVFCVSSIFLWFQYLVYIQWIPYSITLETLLYFLLTLLSSGFYSETIISASLSRLECNREALRNDVLNHRIIVCEVDLHMQRKSIIFKYFHFFQFFSIVVYFSSGQTGPLIDRPSVAFHDLKGL